MPNTKQTPTFATCAKDEVLSEYLPEAVQSLRNEQTTIPRLARDRKALAAIESVLPRLPTHHQFVTHDARRMDFLAPESVHLVLTSPPYWTLKKYNDHDNQLGSISGLDDFVDELNRVWEHCYRALVPGGRLICVVGDVCLSRRKNNGRHSVVPLHAYIQTSCKEIGFDNLAPIIWYKISNAKFEAEGSSSFLGKPYEPNSVIKNDIEFILMERKPGGYRKPSFVERVMSVIPEQDHKKWFNQIWSGVTGASTRNHPAPFPVDLASRLIRMFSFVGDTVLDPFWGTGTVSVAAWQSGRNSIGVEVDPKYFAYALERFHKETAHLWSSHTVDPKHTRK